MQSGGGTKGCSRNALWRDASLDKRRWCVKSASQEVVKEVASGILAEYGKERVLPLLKNPPFTNEVYRGKYETFVGEPPSRSRDRVRPIYGPNDVVSELLRNQLLKHHINPLMPRVQQVETIQRQDAEAKTKVSDTGMDILCARFESAFVPFLCNVVFEDDLCSIKKEGTARMNTKDNMSKDGSSQPGTSVGTKDPEQGHPDASCAVENPASYTASSAPGEYSDTGMEILCARFESAFVPFLCASAYYAATNSSTAAASSSANAYDARDMIKPSLTRKRTEVTYDWLPCKRPTWY